MKRIETNEDKKTAELCKWVYNQIRSYRKGELDPEKKKKLRKLGVHLTKGHVGQVTWQERFDEMVEFFHANNTCLPKRDGPLRRWVLELVASIRDDCLSQQRQKIIERTKIGPYLRPEVIYAEQERVCDTSNDKKRKVDIDISDGEKKFRVDSMTEEPEELDARGVVEV